VGSPEVVGFYSLGDAVGGNACVGPRDGAITISDRPVALIHVRQFRN
jgi:hypothetical protein